MRLSFALALLAMVGLTLPAEAQNTSFSNLLVAGTVAPATVPTTGGSPWCEVGGGNTTFKRTFSAGNFNTTTSPAEISLAEVIYSQGSIGPTGSYTLNGLAYLAFSTAATGTITFPLMSGPASITAPQFSNYLQSYNGNLIVTFYILFPSCKLPIRAVYQH